MDLLCKGAAGLATIPGPVNATQVALSEHPRPTKILPGKSRFLEWRFPDEMSTAAGTATKVDLHRRQLPNMRHG